MVDLIRAKARDAGIPQRTFTNEEIVERAIYALINEGARVLEDRLAMRASDIDTIYVNGYGFPAWRGGPMFYADRVGLGDDLRAGRVLPARVRPALDARAVARTARARGRHVPRAGSPRMPAPCRPIPTHRLSHARVLPPDVIVGRDPDGTIRAQSPHALGPYPERITERLDHWAAVAPGRTFLAARGADGAWRA